MNLESSLKEIISGDIALDAGTLEKFSKDASLFSIRPTCVASPKNTADVQKIVSFVSAHKVENPTLSITVRAAGTDMSGGPLNDGIILDCTKYLNRFHGIEDGCAVVEPGMFYRDFEKETLKQNLIMPSYPASRELCAIGGMVANNSGGERSLTYGQTVRYVEGLNVVLSDGNEYTFGELSEEAVRAKADLPTFEGKVYRGIYKLLTENWELIANAKPKTHKNSTGYLLWEVWNPERKTLNLAKLIVGSQGTLGIVTRAKLRLVRPLPCRKLLVAFLKNLDHLDKIVSCILKFKPESFESYDDHTFGLALRFLPEMIRSMNPKNMLGLGISFLPEILMGVTGGMPKMVLIAEFAGDTEQEVETMARFALQGLSEFNLKTHITRDEDEAKKYWVMRRESFSLLRKHSGGMRTAPFIDDIIVNPDRLPEFLPKLNALLAAYEKDMIYTVAGHIGEGNFHIIPLMDMKKPRSREVIRELGPKVYDLVLAYGGSIAAEHNDGIVRTPYLEQMYGKEVCELFRRVKEIFDPQNIFNPGKKVGMTVEKAMGYLAD